MLNWLKLVLVFLIAGTVTVSTVHAKEISIPGTTVTIDAPDHYTLGARFTGLEYKAKKASLVVNELPAAAKGQLEPLLTDFNTAKVMFKRQNIDLTKTEMVTWQGKQHKIFRGTQAAFGTTFDKWIAGYFGEKVVLVTFQAAPGAVGDAEIKSLFANVSLGKAPTRDEQLSLLPYKFGPLGDVRIAQLMSQNTTGLTIGPKDVDPAGDQPLLVVGPSLNPSRTPDDMKADGMWLLRSVRDLGNFKTNDIKSTAAFNFEGAKGYKIVVDSRNDKTKREMRLIQWVRYNDAGYIRMLAIIPREKAESAEIAFEKVVNGMTFKN